MKSHIAVVLAVLFVATAAAGARFSAAQTVDDDAGGSFDRLYLSFSAYGVRPTAGYDGWSPSPSASISAASPLGVGRAELTVAGRMWTGDDESRPAFTAVFGAVGWAVEMRAGDAVRVLPGFRAGNYLMVFETDETEDHRVESEFAIQPHVTVGFRLGGRARLVAEAAWERVFTAPRLDDASAGLGLEIALDMPDRLERLLR